MSAQCGIRSQQHSVAENNPEKQQRQGNQPVLLNACVMNRKLSDFHNLGIELINTGAKLKRFASVDIRFKISLTH
jgi:hypothetical protein